MFYLSAINSLLCLNSNKVLVRFGILTVVFLRSWVFWDVVGCDTVLLDKYLQTCAFIVKGQAVQSE